MKEPAAFKTVSRPSGPFVLKEKKSKFLGWVFPSGSVAEAEEHLTQLADTYPDATHICYAYRIGVEHPVVRMNDDGEPAYSAGAPIFHQIESEDLFNVLICVVRYYGGTKLGVGGLISAYREAARGALQEARVVTRIPKCRLTLEFEYPLLDAVMRYISHHRLKIASQRMELDCTLELEAPLEACGEIRKGVRALGNVKLRERTTY